MPRNDSMLAGVRDGCPEDVPIRNFDCRRVIRNLAKSAQRLPPEIDLDPKRCADFSSVIC